MKMCGKAIKTTKIYWEYWIPLSEISGLSALTSLAHVNIDILILGP